jgi:hypothetical protein
LAKNAAAACWWAILNEALQPVAEQYEAAYIPKRPRLSPNCSCTTSSGFAHIDANTGMAREQSHGNAAMPFTREKGVPTAEERDLVLRLDRGDGL